MTWIRFALWLAGIYFMYYTAIILMDFFRYGRLPVSDAPDELTFEEFHEPVRAGPEMFPADAVIASGGRSLKQIFSLAREEAIEFTRGVSF